MVSGRVVEAVVVRNIFASGRCDCEQVDDECSKPLD